jgi:hypothetical protein
VVEGEFGLLEGRGGYGCGFAVDGTVAGSDWL